MLRRLFGWAFWPWQRVSLGGGLYIKGSQANRLARMADEAERHPERCINITNMSHEERLKILSRRTPD